MTCGLIAIVLTAGFAQAADGAARPHRVYAQLLNPREHPDDARRHVQPPDWAAFGHRTRFTSLRGFPMDKDRIVGYREEIEKYVRTHDLGEVLWPAYPFLFASNLDEVLDEIRRQGLFMFDVWGYVPGSGPGDYWRQFKVPPETLAMIESKLGAKWLGMDVGEQDGRYIGGYASQMQPASADRFEQYLNFQRHFERLCDDLGNRMSTLVSLNFGHYFIKEGIYAAIGAETAQALPNGQVYYAFIRGAGKQYGVPWFGNASVFNRWGWKVYGPAAADHSPTKGTSLSLMKRLLYSHILYNSLFVGFESSWFEGEKLSPIGRMQQAAQRWVRENGQPGTMATPIALLIDFNAGWTFPRHLYTENVYRVWGNLPYEPGDYLTDGLLDMLYPGYQDSSYFHDESGFIAPTPYGDSADCLLSDAEGWLLDRYPLLVVAGALAGGAEIRDKLEAYVRNEGHLIVTAGSLARLPGGLAGIETAGPCVRLPAGARIEGLGESLTEAQSFELYPLRLPTEAKVLLKCGDVPAAIEVPAGKGRITVLASPFGIGDRAATTQPCRNEVDKPLPKPYPLLKHVRAIVDGAFREQSLFSAGDDLSLITCRRETGLYTLAICNNGWREKPLKIASHCGPIESIREMPLDQSEKTAVGHLPEGMENVPLGTSGPHTIAGGDVRVFEVRVRAENVVPIPHVAPPPRVRGRILPLRQARSIKEEILARPTFFEHFDGVLVDGKYLRERERNELGREAGWIKRQGLRVIVDLSPGINLFPDLRLVDNIQDEYEASMSAIEDVLSKMEALGCRDLVISLHRQPENSFTREQTQAAFEKAVRRVCAGAHARQTTVYLRMSAGKPPWSLTEALDFIRAVGAPNLQLAPSAALLLATGKKPHEISDLLRARTALWFVSAPEHDLAGQLWNAHARIAGHPQAAPLAEFLKQTPDVPIAFDAVYEDKDAEYLDARALESFGISQ